MQRRFSDGQTEIAAAIVYNPATNEMFWAEKGVGAFLNDRRLRVSARRVMSEAVFSTGIPFAKVQEALRAPFLRVLTRLMPQVAGIRRFGAAALDLAWLAAGRYEGFWEIGLKPWDCAAGILLVKEAGGYVTTPEGQEISDFDQDVNVVAGNSHLHGPLRLTVLQSLSE
ncbi:hypothetical protein CGLAMM_11130 [Acetobacteraceae bacterium EV16G]